MKKINLGLRPLALLLLWTLFLGSVAETVGAQVHLAQSEDNWLSGEEDTFSEDVDDSGNFETSESNIESLENDLQEMNQLDQKTQSDELENIQLSEPVFDSATDGTEENDFKEVPPEYQKTEPVVETPYTEDIFESPIEPEFNSPIVEQNNPSLSNEIQGEIYLPEGQDPPSGYTEVEVESLNKKAIRIHDCNCDSIPYSNYGKRRGSWGTAYSFGMSTFDPTSYISEFASATDYETYYGDIDNQLLEFTLSIRKHVSFGAFELELGGGYFKNLSTNISDNAELTVIPGKLSLGFYFDQLASEPYIVPYAKGGISYMGYSEAQNTVTVIGGSGLGFFWAAGSRFKIDWLDQESALVSYYEMGLQNMSLYAEARSFIFSSDDPVSKDFTTDVHIDAGITLEF